MAEETKEEVKESSDKENSEESKDSGESKDSEESKDLSKSEESKESKEEEKDSSTKDDKDSTKEGDTTVISDIEYDLKQPKDSLLADEHIGKVKKIAKDLKLSNEDAQKLLDRDNEVLKSHVESQKTELHEKSVEWVEAIKGDKELGGEKFKSSVEFAKRALDKFGSDEFKLALEETRLGNHPELVRFAARVGRALADDTLVLGGGSQPAAKKSTADVLYGQSTPAK